MAYIPRRILPGEKEAWLTPTNYFRRLTLAEIFPQRPDAPFEVDLGCGDGGFLESMAKAFPDRNFLGIERLMGRARKVARRAARGGLGNLKIMRIETAYSLNWILPEKSVSRLHLLFPDPWPREKHHDRRIFHHPDFRAGLNRILVDGGEFISATDDLPYHEALQEALQGWEEFKPLPWPPDEFYATTDFEIHWAAMNRSTYRTRSQRVDRIV